MRHAIIKKSKQPCYVIGELILAHATEDAPAKVDRNYLRVLINKTATKIPYAQAQALYSNLHEQLVRANNITYSKKQQPQHARLVAS